MVYRHSLPVTSIVNIRDLGGYATNDGGITKYGVFLRSAITNKVSKKDLDFLHDYGVRLNLDFRHTSHATMSPSSFSLDSRFQYVNLPVHLRVSKNSKFDHTFSWMNEYPQSLDAGTMWIKNAFRVILSSQGGCLFNCNTGKDRTGIFSAVLLLVAGVNVQDIVDDYSISEKLVQNGCAMLSDAFPNEVSKDGNVDFSNPFFFCSPEYMKNLIDHIFRKYGSIEYFLKYCGVSEQETAEIKKRFVSYI